MKKPNIEIVFFFRQSNNNNINNTDVNDRTNRDEKILSISKKNAAEKHCFGWAWTHSIYVPSKLCWWFIPFLEASLAIHLPPGTRRVNNNRPIYNHIFLTRQSIIVYTGFQHPHLSLWLSVYLHMHLSISKDKLTHIIYMVEPRFTISIRFWRTFATWNVHKPKTFFQ